jgi:hypothetical protein
MANEHKSQRKQLTLDNFLAPAATAVTDATTVTAATTTNPTSPTSHITTYEEYIVLVTGSRDWEKEEIIHQALEDISCSLDAHLIPVLVHGDCPAGADRIAHIWASKQPKWVIRKYPAQWKTQTGSIDLSAGPKRNTMMINKENPHVVLGFRKNQSRGTTHAINVSLKNAKKLTTRTQSIVVYDCATVNDKTILMKNRLIGC